MYRFYPVEHEFLLLIVNPWSSWERICYVTACKSNRQVQLTSIFISCNFPYCRHREKWIKRKKSKQKWNSHSITFNFISSLIIIDKTVLYLIHNIILSYDVLEFLNFTEPTKKYPSFLICYFILKSLNFFTRTTVGLLEAFFTSHTRLQWGSRTSQKRKWRLITKKNVFNTITEASTEYAL